MSVVGDIRTTKKILFLCMEHYGQHGSLDSFIGSGSGNTISSSCSAIVGGSFNTISAGNFVGFIGGGSNNTLNANLSTIAGGRSNIIDTGSNCSFIGGGYTNSICAGFIDSVIGGGSTNCVLSNCSSILGGFNNYVASDYSVILGGSGNKIPAGLPYSGVFGQNVSALASNMFHVECLNACGTPLTGTGAACTLSYIIATPGMVAVGFPFGSKIAMIG
jgi:hypothetical protein